MDIDLRLQEARAALSADPDESWTWYYRGDTPGSLKIYSEAPPLRELAGWLDGGLSGLLTGELVWDPAGETLIFYTQAVPGPDVEALEALVGGPGVRVEAEGEPEALPEHPYPLLKELFNLLQGALEAWEFLYVAADPDQPPILEIAPEGPAAGVALSYQLDGRRVYTGRSSFDLDGSLVLEVEKGHAEGLLKMLQEDYGAYFAILENARVEEVEAPPEAPAQAAGPDADDMPRLRGMVKGRVAALQKGQAGRFAYFSRALDGKPLLAFSRPGAALEGAIRLAGSLVAEGDYLCIVPGGVELSAVSAFDVAAVAAELDIRIRFAKT